MIKYITLPMNDETAESLRAGDTVRLSGSILVARDAAHKRLTEAMKADEAPVSVQNEVVYYAGPTPTSPGEAIGSIGPTTSYRMDPYTPYLIEHGLRGMIGKGKRSPEVVEAMKKYKAVYFGATGGAAVLLASSVTHAEPVAYEDLGPEAILRLEIHDMPVTVIIDCHGGNLYETGPAKAISLIK